MRRTKIFVVFALATLGLTAGASPASAATCNISLAAPATTGPLAQLTTNSINTLQGASGFAVSRDNSNNSPTPKQQIVWAIGDRSGNELGTKSTAATGNNKVWLFGYDALDGSLAIRYNLDPADLQVDPHAKVTGDTISSIAGKDYTSPDTDSMAIPDFEDIGIRYNSAGRDTIYLFDTGQPGGSQTTDRPTTNIYTLMEPDLTQSGLGLIGPNGGDDPMLKKKATGGTLNVVRRPLEFHNTPGGAVVHPNIEGAFVDPVNGFVYMVQKTPTTFDGDAVTDDFRVYELQSLAGAGVVNQVTYQTDMWFTDNANDGGLRVDGASVLYDGTMWAFRVNGGRIYTFSRLPGMTVGDTLKAQHDPNCALTGATGGTETIAFRFKPGPGASGWNGFIWTSDLTITDPYATPGTQPPFWSATATVTP